MKTVVEVFVGETLVWTEEFRTEREAKEKIRAHWGEIHVRNKFVTDPRGKESWYVAPSGVRYRFREYWSEFGKYEII